MIAQLIVGYEWDFLTLLNFVMKFSEIVADRAMKRTVARISCNDPIN